MTVTPFHFNLKKVSGEDERLLAAINSYLPAIGMEDEFAKAINGAVTRHAGEEFSLKMESLHHEPAEKFLAGLPQTAVMVVVSMPPLSGKAIVEIDSMLAMMVIERMLGGTAETMPEPRVLSDTEQGVLQYLILQVLAQIHRTCGRDERVHFRFDRFAFRPHEVRDMVGGVSVAVCSFRVLFGRRAGFMRLALPDPFAAEAFLDISGRDETRLKERAWRLKQIGRFGFVRLPVWAEAGQMAISRRDLADLEEEDVVIFDKSEIVVADGRPKGRVILRVGDGLSGGIDAEIIVDRKRLRLKVIGVHEGE